MVINQGGIRILLHGDILPFQMIWNGILSNRNGHKGNHTVYWNALTYQFRCGRECQLTPGRPATDDELRCVDIRVVSEVFESLIEDIS